MPFGLFFFFFLTCRSKPGLYIFVSVSIATKKEVEVIEQVPGKVAEDERYFKNLGTFLRQV